jgi:hypothetical protein
MPNDRSTGSRELDFLAQLAAPSERRKFLKWSGVTIAVAAVGCRTDQTTQPATRTPPGAQGAVAAAAVSLGTGDVAILNYAYALEQLEAAFYTQVAANFGSSDLSAAERAILDDIRKHEVVHREFFKAALTAVAPGQIIPTLGAADVDFSSVDFTSRASVLGTAKVFEDLGVSAYNGAGALISNLDYLVIAGKIVSVEARHAAAIRDLLNPKSADFAGDDVVDANGLDVVNGATAVLAAADPFIVPDIDASGFPTA